MATNGKIFSTEFNKASVVSGETRILSQTPGQPVEYVDIDQIQALITAEISEDITTLEQTVADNKTEAEEVLGNVSSSLAESGCSLDERVAALEKALIALCSGDLVVEKMVVRNLQVFGQTSLIEWGESAPVVAPDFVGQIYINTEAKAIYIATANDSTSDWKTV